MTATHDAKHEHARRLGLTKGAQKVLELLEQSHQLSSAQDIYGKLRTEESKPPGLTTVYRSLESLVQMGLVQAVDLGDGERRYEVVEPGEHHHHLVCKECGGSTHMDSCLVEEIEDKIKTKYRFEIDSHIFEVFGTCDSCSAKKGQK